MKQKNMVQMTLTLLIAVLFLVVFSQASTFAIQTFLPGKIFSEGTYIGGVDVSSLNEQAASVKLTERTNEWMKNAKINVQLLNQEQQLAPGFFQFDLQGSIESAVDGKKNQLQVNVRDDRWGALLRSMDISLLESSLDKDGLDEKLIKNAQTLSNAPLIVNLSDYLIGGAYTEDFQTIYDHIKETDTLAQWVKESGMIELQPGELFSLKEYIEKHELTYSDEFMTIAASMMYEAALHSSLKIVERHTSEYPPENIKEGFEAKISKDYDLKLYNGDSHPVQIISFSDASGSLAMKLKMEGNPFSYKVIQKNRKTYPPREIVEFVPLKDQVKSESGREGYSVEIVKETLLGKLPLLKELISKDFYLPIDKRVYKEVEAPPAENQGGDGGVAESDAPGAGQKGDAPASNQNGAAVSPPEDAEDGQNGQTAGENQNPVGNASEDPATIYDNETIIK
ncbi:VanW family protein [Falsibacillus pallidus]|uniref:VanW family protein n=1 Tax=Falsibacillus pallidus TaxID=493781 RepID=UPI003D95130F